MCPSITCLLALMRITKSLQNAQRLYFKEEYLSTCQSQQIVKGWVTLPCGCCIDQAVFDAEDYDENESEIHEPVTQTIYTVEMPFVWVYYDLKLDSRYVLILVKLISALFLQRLQ